MNFKAMNMKKGLKRFWIIGSVFWFVCPWIPPQFEVFGFDLDETIYRVFVYWIVSQVIWWALLYVGFGQPVVLSIMTTRKWVSRRVEYLNKRG